MPESHVMKYVSSETGEAIEVKAPWGYHSGRIPPPNIAFWRRGQADLVFTYSGDES